MGDVLRKVFWGLVGLVAVIFMIGFGICAATGFTAGLPTLVSGRGFPESLLVPGLAVLGAALAWGFAKLAAYSNRQMQSDESDDRARQEWP